MAINDDKWKLLFERHDIIKEVAIKGHFDITATQIRTVREPRLMCKMDFRQAVAKPFKDNGLSILAIKNGIYRIAKTSPFFDIDLSLIGKIKVTDLHLPPFIETLHYQNITGESQALDAAVASGMLSSLLKEDSFLTVRGRRYSTNIDIKIPRNDKTGSQNYPVSSVQIEVDGGYEGKSKLALIEAKMGTADNMNMRQLIYPHAHFEKLTKKEVKTYLMFYETGSLFTFIPMIFEKGSPSLDYQNSVRYRLVETARRTVVKKKKTITLPYPGHDAPFPQADDFEKVLFGFFKVADTPLTEAEVFSELPITPRQYNYYFNAMRWLGLVEKSGQGKPMYLTSLGETLLEMDESFRLGTLLEIIQKHEIVQHIIKKPKAPLPENLKVKYGLMGKSMYPRRKSTIESWLGYLNSKLNSDSTNPRLI